MFKGRIYVYKNVNGEEEEKEFDNEKSFIAFLEKNPFIKDTKIMGTIKWPKSVFDMKTFINDSEKIGEIKRVHDIENELDKIFKDTHKLLR